MNSAYSHIFSLLDTLIGYTIDLHHSLIKEKKALIEFNIDELAPLNLKKESLMIAIMKKRVEIGEYLKICFNIDKLTEFEKVIEEEYRKEWCEKLEKWKSIWNMTKDTCEANQRFLKRSINNLSLLIENFKKVFGRYSLYTVKGKRRDLEFSEYLASA